MEVSVYREDISAAFLKINSGHIEMPFYEFENKRPSVDSKAFVHPEAVLIGDVTLSAGCYVGAGAVLRGDIGSIVVGAGSNVQENCVFHTFPEKNVILAPNCHVGHGAILHGCEIGSHVLIGMGAIISDDVKIASECLVGAGSFVPFGMDVPNRSVVMGSPGRVVKDLSDAQLEKIKQGLSIYQELARRYLVSFKPLP